MQILRDIQAVINDIDDADIHCQWFNLITDLFGMDAEEITGYANDIMSDINGWIERNTYTPSFCPHAEWGTWDRIGTGAGGRIW